MAAEAVFKIIDALNREVALFGDTPVPRRGPVSPRPPRHVRLCEHGRVER